MSIQQNSDYPKKSSGGSGIRLPPISFLSGGNTPLSSMISPIERQSHDHGNGGVFQTQRGNEKKVSLPEPQPLNLYPTHSSTHAPKPASSPIRNDSVNLIQNQQSNATNETTKPEGPRGVERHVEGGNLHHYHHHHHHHHVPQHHHRHHHHHHKPHKKHSQALTSSDESGSKPTSNGAQKRLHPAKLSEIKANGKKRQKKIFRSRIYDQLAEQFPERRQLGTLVYNPTTTWESLQFEQLTGLSDHDKDRLSCILEDFRERKCETQNDAKTKYVPMIPPLSGAYINNFLEVKIAYKHIKEFLDSVAQGKAERKRVLWGGAAGIYTDDSDLLYVLSHLGLFNGELDLTESNGEWTPSDLTRPTFVQTDKDGVDLLDLSVTLLLLPGLNQYRGFYKNGLNSRSWMDKSVHTGLSYAVYSVKWNTLLSSMGDRTLSKKATKEYIEDKMSSEEILAQKKGWEFDFQLHQDVKEKISGVRQAEGS